MSENFSSFSSYHKTVLSLRDSLAKLREYSRNLDLTGIEQSITDTLNKSAEDTFNLAVVGEFKRGKSTLINALLGDSILPADIRPCSATLNCVTYGITPFVKITQKNGETEDVGIDKMADYVTKLSSESEKRASEIQKATVYYPIDYCKNNVNIIDTPGLNDDQNMTDVTLSIIPQSDVSIFVIMANAPFSKFEADFLENKMLVSDVGRIVFVVTRIDMLSDDDEVERILSYVRSRIQRYIIEKAKRVFGENSKEFNNCEQKLGGIKVIGISPKQALAAKKNKDEQLLKKSRYPEFEKELEWILTRERGAIQLQAQINKTISATQEILKTVELRDNALKMSEEEYKEKYESAKAKISQIREERTKELNHLECASNEIFKTVKPLADGYNNEIIKAANQVVDDAQISENDLKKENVKATQELILSDVQKAVQNTAQVLTERIQGVIDKEIGQQLDALKGFEDSFFETLSTIQNDFSAKGDIDSETMKNAAIMSAAASVTGGALGGAAGGIYSVYKKAGVKGALVGGAVSAASTVAVAVPLMTVLSVLGIATVGWVLIPAFAVSGMVGAFTGKKVLDKMFPSQSEGKFKDSLKKDIAKKLEEMTSTKALGTEVKQQIEEILSGIRKKVNDETELILADTEKTLAELDKQVASKTVLEKKEREELEKMVTSVADIAIKAMELNAQLSKAMSA